MGQRQSKDTEEENSDSEIEDDDYDEEMYIDFIINILIKYKRLKAEIQERKRS